MQTTASRLLAWISSLSAPELYSLGAACVLVVWLLYWLGRDVCLWGWRQCHGVFWRASKSQQPSTWQRLLFVYLPRTLQWLDISTYVQALTVALLLAANFIGVGFRTNSWTERQRRAGALAVIHFLPLCTGLTFGLPADLLHMNRQTFAWLHRWFGRLCTLQSLLHSSMLVSIAHTSSLATFRYMVPLVAGCALVLVMLITLQAIRQRHPQVAMKCHYALAVLAIGALVYHLVERQSLYRWYLLGAVCIWLLASFTVCMLTVWAYKPWRKSAYEVSMSAPNQLLWLDVSVPSGWTMRPGQYVQVWMPRAGTRARLQLLLFYVAVWEENEIESLQRIHMVAQPRSGLTTKLYQAALHRAVLVRNMAEQGDRDQKLLDPQAMDPTLRQPAVVLGPYGCADDFSRFGTVLFIVEGVGFFRVLSYIGMLVEASRKRQTMVRKLEIIWQGGVFGTILLLRPQLGFCGGLIEQLVDHYVADYPQWLVRWFRRMFLLDKEGFNILQIHIYCLQAADGSQRSVKTGERVCYYNGSVDVRKEVSRYVQDQTGDMAVAVCAGPLIYNTVQQAIQPYTGRHLELVSLDLGPCHRWARKTDPLENGTGALAAQFSHPQDPMTGSTRLARHKENSHAIFQAHPEQYIQRPSAGSADRQLSNHDKWVELKLAEGQRSV